jgi:arginyl-tRNA synthetase
MQLTVQLRDRLLATLTGITTSPEVYADMVRPTTDTRFGDFQFNGAMSLAKAGASTGSTTNPREVARQIVERLAIDDLCETPQIAGPGFINLTLKNEYLSQQLVAMASDERCLVPAAAKPQRFVIDFSSPNIAKPMHVGHIRSTVIGDALTHILRFLGHYCVTDNHLGDWGTQFGIIIYGYKHFGDPQVVAAAPVAELATLYRTVHQLMSYEQAIEKLPVVLEQLKGAQRERESELARSYPSDEKEAKKREKTLANWRKKIESLEVEVQDLQSKIDSVRKNASLMAKAEAHPNINQAVLFETAKLHQGDSENIGLWKQFLPHCMDEIERVYRRLKVSFDHVLGESFYHPLLAGVIQHLQQLGLAKTSEGAICVFLDEFETPMIIQKQDGAYLYATTDLATLKYRLDEFQPDHILYVVDTRQSEHFEKLFAVARLMGLEHIGLTHVNFGTVLGEDGRPLKTRSGTLIGLEGLLNDAVQRAKTVVCDPERLEKITPPMDENEQKLVAETVGIGAIKYADLSHHRTSDYRFSLDKMVSLDGNTSAYVQYSYARTRGILRKGNVSESEIINRVASRGIFIKDPAERQLALRLLAFEDALQTVKRDYSPNGLVDYLYDTAKAYAVFNDNCNVLKAENEQLVWSRLAMVMLSGRVLKLGLHLLGIGVVERM